MTERLHLGGVGQAGWLGQDAQLHPLIELVICVPPGPGARCTATPQIPPDPGGPRRPGDRGRVGDDGTIREAYQGPLHSRAAGPGVRLVESERRAEDFDSFEDLLYQGAAHAGWLAVDAHGRTVGEIPAVEIVIRIPRQGAARA